VTLALWRDDPVVGNCLNQAIPSDFPSDSRTSITFRVEFIYEDGSRYPAPGRRIDQFHGGSPPLYPGRLEAGELPDPPRLMDLYVGVQRGGSRVFEAYTPPVGLPDDLGYQKHRGGNAPAFFVLPAERRLGHASRPLEVPCDDSDPLADHCSISVRSDDSSVGLRLEWLGPTSKFGWAAYDAAARKMARAIFIDHPADDLQ
jgi:hypothetical protein